MRTSAAHGVARAAYEEVTILEQQGRKRDAEEACRDLQRTLNGQPFFDVTAAVSIALANFALDAHDIAEAERLADEALALCRAHDLETLATALVLKDRVETLKQAGAVVTPATATEIAGRVHRELEKAPANADGCLRLWMFSLALDFRAAIRARVGPNLAIVTDDIDEFRVISSRLRPYRDLSIIVCPTKYPDDIVETIPLAGDMLIPPRGVAILAFKRTSDHVGDETVDQFEDFEQRWASMTPEGRAELSLASRSTGATLARYHFVELASVQGEAGRPEAGLYGTSLALPPAVHEMFRPSNARELRDDRLFYLYYNRGTLAESARLTADAEVLGEVGCIPVYVDALPGGERVRLVASCTLRVPSLCDERAEEHRRSLRDIRGALLEAAAADERHAASALAHLSAALEELMEISGAEESMSVGAHVLALSTESGPSTSLALVVSAEHDRPSPGHPSLESLQEQLGSRGTVASGAG
jgi:hypothetical protein